MLGCAGTARGGFGTLGVVARRELGDIGGTAVRGAEPPWLWILPDVFIPVSIHQTQFGAALGWWYSQNKEGSFPLFPFPSLLSPLSFPTPPAHSGVASSSALSWLSEFPFLFDLLRNRCQECKEQQLLLSPEEGSVSHSGTGECTCLAR